MTDSNLDKIVFAHADVVAGAMVGYVRSLPSGELELHPSIDTVGADLNRVSLSSIVEHDSSIAEITALRPSQHGWRWEPASEFRIARLPTGRPTSCRRP